MQAANVPHVLLVSAMYQISAAKLNVAAWQFSYQYGGGYIWRLVQSNVLPSHLQVVVTLMSSVACKTIYLSW